jgi:hypothetical protein
VALGQRVKRTTMDEQIFYVRFQRSIAVSEHHIGLVQTITSRYLTDSGEVNNLYYTNTSKNSYSALVNILSNIHINK